MNELCSSPRCVIWCTHFIQPTPYLFFGSFCALLLCICGTLRDPSCIPCSECMPIFITSHVRTRLFVFFAGVDHELCDHMPPPFFFIVRELRGVSATHALYLSLVSLSPRSLTPGPLQRILELCTSLHCASDAPAPPVACPLDPAPQARSVKAAVFETQMMRCARPGNMWICIAHSPPSRFFFDSSISYTTGPLVVSQDPLWLLLGGNGDGVLTDNERYVFPPTQPTLDALRGAFESGG